MLHSLLHSPAARSAPLTCFTVCSTHLLQHPQHVPSRDDLGAHDPQVVPALQAGGTPRLVQDPQQRQDVAIAVQAQEGRPRGGGYGGFRLLDHLGWGQRLTYGEACKMYTQAVRAHWASKQPHILLT